MGPDAVTHTCHAPEGRVFCRECGSVVDREGFRSIRFGAVGGRGQSKATVDVHDGHTVTVTESASDRVDVAVKQLNPVKLRGPVVAGTDAPAGR